MCLPQDRPCHVLNPLWGEKDHRPVACKWFLNSVLPLDPRLESVVRRQQEGSEIAIGENVKTCADCGSEFIPTNNRQRYCPFCGKSRRKQRRAQAERKRRQALKAG